MATSASEVTELVGAQERDALPPIGKGKRGKSTDIMSSMEARLQRVELAMADERDKVEETNQRIEGLEGSHEEFQGEIQGALNSLTNSWKEQLDALKNLFQAEIAAMKEEIKEVKGDMSLCKMAIARGTISSSLSPKIDIPRPKSYNGSRNARELDNFLWNLDQYFDAMGMEDDARKIKTAPLFLSDAATLWWRRRHADIERGTCTMTTWDDFKREIKRQFYPINSEHEARAKLRRLSHKGSIRDYVKEFSELMLEIPDMSEKESLFTFIDGLQSWAKLEVQRRGPQDLATAISIVESLVDFKEGESSSSMLKFEKFNQGEGGEDNEEEHKPSSSNHGNFYRDKRSGDKPKLACFLCEGNHLARNCPKRAKLSALIQDDEEEPRHEEAKVGSLRLLNAIKAKMDLAKTTKKGRMYVEAKVRGFNTRALVDTGASHNFMEVKEAKRLGLQFKEEQGWIKAVNTDARPIYGVARDVRIHIGDWCGQVDFTVVPMDDYPIVLGMEFLDGVRAFPIPFAETMCIMGEGSACMVPLAREATLKAKALSAIQLLEDEPTSFKPLELTKESSNTSTGMPRMVEEVLEDNKCVMALGLPKGLPPKGEVDHFNKLEVEAECSHILEHKPGKANLVADTPSRKTELATMPQCSLKEGIKEGLSHDQGTTTRIDGVSQGKHRQSWREDDPLLTKGNQIHVHKLGTSRKWMTKEGHNSKRAVHSSIRSPLTLEGHTCCWLRERDTLDYLVMWKGQPDNKASWEPKESIWQFTDKIAKFCGAATRASPDWVGENVTSPLSWPNKQAHGRVKRGKLV